MTIGEQGDVSPPKSHGSELATYGVLLLSCIAVVLADVALPLGVAVGSAYTVIVLLAALAGGRRSVWFTAGLASLFTVGVYVLTADGSMPWFAVANRALSLASIWAVAIPVLLTSPRPSFSPKRSRFRLLPLVLALPAFFVVPVIAGLNATALAEATDNAQADRQSAAIERLIGEIARLDEVLTMSAVAASQTTDSRWSERYAAHAPMLDTALAELVERVPPEQRGEVEQTVAANSALVVIEQAALTLSEAGDARGSQELLSQDAYIREKSRYSQGLAELRLELLARTEELASLNSSRIVATRHLINLSSLALALMWVIATLILLRTIRQLSQANQDLVVQKRALAQLNRELEQFAYVASHDMQEPLRMVVEFAKRLDADPGSTLTQRGTTYLRFVTQGAERLRVLVDDLLTYARLDTDMTSEPVELDAVLASVLVDLTPAITESGAVVRSAPLPCIHGNATRLHQLFVNLIGNAIKFRADTPPVIHIGCETRERSCVITVRDNGIGIEPKYYRRIFQMFQRLHGADEYTGTGIGLALCQKIVHQHGGRIWIDQSVVDGSSFKMSFPLRPRSALESR